MNMPISIYIIFHFIYNTQTFQLDSSSALMEVKHWIGLFTLKDNENLIHKCGFIEI